MDVITISKRDPVKNDVRWVLKARGKDVSRYNLQHVAIYRKTMVATDGHRLHMATLKHSSFKPGVYSVVSDKAGGVILKEVEEGANYPDWKRVINTRGKKVSLPFNTTIAGSAYTVAVRNIQEGAGIDYRYFSDVVTDGAWRWTMFINSNIGNPLKFRSGNKTAIVMPVRL
jgi:hypothetical protein